jgi:hypothetical protein
MLRIYALSKLFILISIQEKRGQTLTLLGHALVQRTSYKQRRTVITPKQSQGLITQSSIILISHIVTSYQM